MANSTERTEFCLKRTIRYLLSQPGGACSCIHEERSATSCFDGLTAIGLGMSSYASRAVAGTSSATGSQFPLEYDSGKHSAILWGSRANN